MTTKRILFIVLCVVSALSASAQSVIGKYVDITAGITGVIPKLFCKDNAPLIIASNNKIYDGDLNMICKVNTQNTLGKTPIRLRFRDYDDGTYFSRSDDRNEDFIFTQTLFNNDEHFEYVVRDGDVFCVFNDEGKVVLKFSIGLYTCDIIKIKGNYYFRDDYRLWKINREGAESGTNKVSVSRAEDIGETRYFGLSGQEVNPQSTSEKIIIKNDGKKSVKVVNR